MDSILNEICKLRQGASLAVDLQNHNRYRVVAIEPDHSRTAYYFTTPIYNHKTRKALDMQFHSNGNMVYATGSNADITIGESIRLENPEGFCVISLDAPISHCSEHDVVCGSKRIRPTTNGVAIKSDCQQGVPYTFSIETSIPFLDVWANDKCFALMSERFRPFVAVSCIGTSDTNGNIISPAKTSYQKISDRKYTLTVTPCSALGKYVLIEANLYEAKLFQDTTVESKNPKINNAFGSVGFIGSTKEFGEQWLYTRPDFAKMADLNDRKILRAVLHLPRLNSSAVALSAFGLTARFCSFGSTWDNKIRETSSIADSQTTDDYIDLNLLPILTDKHRRLSANEGLILKSKKKDSGFSVIATGDSSAYPQVLEINYL